MLRGDKTGASNPPILFMTTARSKTPSSNNYRHVCACIDSCWTRLGASRVRGAAGSCGEDGLTFGFALWVQVDARGTTARRLQGQVTGTVGSKTQMCTHAHTGTCAQAPHRHPSMHKHALPHRLVSILRPTLNDVAASRLWSCHESYAVSTMS